VHGRYDALGARLRDFQTMPYRLAAFDFDGTLADSFDHFVASVNTLAKRHGFREMDMSRLDDYRGLEPRELMRLHGVPMWKLPLIVKDYTALMGADLARIRPFEGAVAAMRTLSERGVAIGIVTSNAEANVRHVLGDELMSHIRFIECGASLFGKRSRLQRLMRAANMPKADCIYVGDHPNDGEAARAAGIAFGAVHYGYASAQSLERCGPALRFRHAAELQLIAS
jgi:phosphoglycolate phosphatase